MNNNLTWLLVADAGKARIFSLHKAKLFSDIEQTGLLSLINEFTHHESRMKNMDLVTSKRGESGLNSLGSDRPKHHEAEVFAHQLMEQLNTARIDHHFQDLILIAPPAFMGILNKHMPNEIHKLISKKIEKDYTQESLNDLTKKLVTHL